MNREAAALGVPVYSIFRGTIGAVDEYLSREGRLTLIESEDDVKKKIKLIRRDRSSLPKDANRRVLENIVDQVTALEKDLRVARSRPRRARAGRV